MSADLTATATTGDTAASPLLEEARAGFLRAFDREPEGVWSAPGRVNLIGEHTDYNDGFVLPFAIDRRSWVAVGRRDDRLVRVASSLADDVVEIALDDIARDSVSGWSAYPFATAWGMGRIGADLAAVPGVDAWFDSDVPLGAGLSSSAAIECSLAVALADVWGLAVDRQALVHATHRAENDVVGAPTGTLDQSASLLSEPDAAILIDCRTGVHEVVELGLEEAGLTALVIDTRVQHAHTDGGYAARRASCERAARVLGVPALRDLTADDLPRAAELLDDETFRRARHVVTEDERVLATVAALRDAGPRAVGDLLVASHASLRDDFEVTVPELDAAVELAVAAGAVGARMTGGGFGGAVIALVADEVVPAVEERVRAGFAERGYADPAVFRVQPSPGARRDA